MKALAAIRVQKIASMSTIQAAEVHGRRRDEPSSKRVNACRSSLNLEDSKKPPNLSRTFLLCGQVSDFRGVDILLADFPDETKEVIGDRGYDSNQIWLSFAERNITACIPPKKNWKSKLPYNWHLYKKRQALFNIKETGLLHLPYPNQRRRNGHKGSLKIRGFSNPPDRMLPQGTVNQIAKSPK